MSIGDKSLRRQDLTAEKLRGVSSPGKMVGKADRPSNVDALGALAVVGVVDVADAGPADVALAADVDARILALQAKIDELIAALK